MSQPTITGPFNTRKRSRTESIGISITEIKGSVNLHDLFPNVNPLYEYTPSNIKLVLDKYLLKRQCARQNGTGIISDGAKALQTPEGATFSFGDFETVKKDELPNDRHNFAYLRLMVDKIIDYDRLYDAIDETKLISKHIILVPFSIQEGHVALAIIKFTIEKKDADFYVGSNLEVEIDDPILDARNYFSTFKEQLFYAFTRFTNPTDISSGQPFTVTTSRTSCKLLQDTRDSGVVAVARIVEFLDHSELSQSYQGGMYNIGDIYQLRNRHLSAAPEFISLQRVGMPDAATLLSLTTINETTVEAEKDIEAKTIKVEDTLGNKFHGHALNGFAVDVGDESINGSEYTGHYQDGLRVGKGLEKNAAATSGFGIETSFNGLRETETKYLTGDIRAIVPVDTSKIDLGKEFQILPGFKVLYEGPIKDGLIHGKNGKISIVGFKQTSLGLDQVCIDVCDSDFDNGSVVFTLEQRPNIRGLSIILSHKIIDLACPDKPEPPIEHQPIQYKFQLHANPNFYETAFNIRNELIKSMPTSRCNSLEPGLTVFSTSSPGSNASSTPEQVELKRVRIVTTDISPDDLVLPGTDPQAIHKPLTPLMNGLNARIYKVPRLDVSALGQDSSQVPSAVGAILSAASSPRCATEAKDGEETIQERSSPSLTGRT